MANDEILNEIMKKLENLERENEELKKKVKTKEEEKKEEKERKRYEELKSKLKIQIPGFRDFKEPVALEELEQFYAVLEKMLIVRDIKQSIEASRKGLSFKTLMISIGVAIVVVVGFLIKITFLR